MKHFECTTYLKKNNNNVAYKVTVYWHKNWLGPWKKKFGSPAGPWRKNVKLCPWVKFEPPCISGKFNREGT
jgi:hypothetical protein